jgi:hypothetical protein
VKGAYPYNKAVGRDENGAGSSWKEPVSGAHCSAIGADTRHIGGLRLTIIHGYIGGTALRDMIYEEFAHHPRVIRLERGRNPGQTVLVLREY